jgi:lysozyme
MKPLIFAALYLFLAGCGEGEPPFWDELSGAKGEWSYATSRVCPRDGDAKTDLTALPVQGFDVSLHQSVDWEKVRGSGKVFAIARAANGLREDPTFVSHFQGIATAGLVRGAYQFFRPTQDAEAQAKLFLKKLEEAGGLGADDLPPVLDIEVHDASAAVVQSRLQTWIEIVGGATGTLPIIYTMGGMSSLLGTGFGHHRLWVANFYQTCPRTPEGWPQWDFHQYTDQGRIPGILNVRDGRVVSQDVDLDVFNGSLEEFQQLVDNRGFR